MLKSIAGYVLTMGFPMIPLSRAKLIWSVGTLKKISEICGNFKEGISQNNCLKYLKYAKS
jgi:hypothetical protein